MSPRAVIFLLFWLVCISGYGQKNETDSLESLVKSLPADTTKVWLLNKLVLSLRDKDSNKALRYAGESKNLAELLVYKPGLATALENIGWILYRKGDYTKAFDNSTQALKISEELHDRAAMARCLISIAAISFEQKQYDRAIENFRSSHRMAKEIGDDMVMARSLNNIAYTFLQLNNLDSALFYARKGLTISSKFKEQYMTGFAQRTLGDVYLLRKDYDKALVNFESCFRISDQEGNNFLKVSTLHRLGRTYKEKGEYHKALAYFFKNIDLANQFGYKDELERTYKLIFQTYDHLHDIPKAYEFQSKFLQIHDSLTDQRQNETITLMEARFNDEIKVAKIDLLTKDAELKEEEINGQKVLLYFYVGCLSLFVILVFVLLYIIRYTSLAKKQLEGKNKAINTQAQQLQNLNATKDKLFSIISHDLRSPLAGLKALMELVGTPGLSQDEFVNITLVLKRNLDSVHEDLDNLLLWAQTQLNGLQGAPEALDIKSLAAEKVGLFREAAESKKISIANDISEDAVVFADRNHISLVFRNLIGNAIKFNPVGGSIRLTSEHRGNHYEISVEDSGVGLSYDDLNKLFNAETHFTKPGTNKERGVGIGLLLTKEFVENNHGSIWVTSELGKGTIFTFTVRSHQEVILN
jgi:two-component system sensor histidine kinase/response regulator